jgi:hypothetical protein
MMTDGQLRQPLVALVICLVSQRALGLASGITRSVMSFGVPGGPAGSAG